MFGILNIDLDVEESMENKHKLRNYDQKDQMFLWILVTGVLVMFI